MTRLRACRVVESTGRLGGDAEDVYPAGGDVHDEEHVQPAKPDCVEVEEVGGEQPDRPLACPDDDCAWYRAVPH